MKKPITVLIADDHPIFRKGLREVLSEDADIQLVADAADGQVAMQKIRELKPQVAVLDMDMPGLSGLQIARKVLDLKLPVAVVILTLYKEERVFSEAIDAGVIGYILKENAEGDLLNCVHAVANGKSFISPSLSSLLLDRDARAKKLLEEKPGLDSLTTTERRVLKLVAQDLTSKEIAERLGISFHTVENHRANISEKLDLRGSHSLLKFAFANRDRL